LINQTDSSINKKKKLLIVISGDLFIRNYLLTNAFSEIESHYDCHLVANIDTTIREDLMLKEGFKGFYEIDKRNKEGNQKIFDTLMLIYRKRSRSFLFRIKRAAPDFKRVKAGPKKRLILRFFRWIILKPFLIVKRTLLDFELINRLYLNKLLKNVNQNDGLKSYITACNYDLIIFPSSAYGADGIDVAKICNDNKIKSLFLVDNWDNLSSKSIMWQKPTYLGVWGEQSKEHAIKIQDIEKDNIFLMGTPRFDIYFKSRQSTEPSYFDFRYILFVGTALDFDEESLLGSIDDVIEKNKSVWGDIKIIYRPHPWRQNNIEVLSSYGVNIITDPQILDARNDKTTKFQPKLEYYPGLLKNAEFIMGGLTSMLIEGLIFRKQFLAFVHDDDKYISNMRNAWEYFEHFKGLDDMEALKFSYDETDIEKMMLKCWKERDLLDSDKIDQKRMWYLYNDEEYYQDRLLNLVNNLVS